MIINTFGSVQNVFIKIVYESEEDYRDKNNC